MTGSRIYTKTGDDGTTGLLHGGRVSKGDQLAGAYGDIDGAAAALGAARARACGHLVSDEVLCYLNRLSDLLFVLARHAAGDAAEPVSHD